MAARFGTRQVLVIRNTVNFTMSGLSLIVLPDKWHEHFVSSQNGWGSTKEYQRDSKSLQVCQASIDIFVQSARPKMDQDQEEEAEIKVEATWPKKDQERRTPFQVRWLKMKL